MDLTTPAVLLSTISLLILAFTNRFLTMTGRARELHKEYKTAPDEALLMQLERLLSRIHRIRDAMTIGVASLFFFVFTMFLIFTEHADWAHHSFFAGLLLLMVALAVSTYEIYLSCNAIDIQLKELENNKPLLKLPELPLKSKSPNVEALRTNSKNESS